jgi:hypothetical protein
MNASPPVDPIEQLVEQAAAHFWTPAGLGIACCALALPNGFTVVGKSPFFDESQFDPETAARLAFADACSELARLELYRQATTPRIALATARDVMAMKGANG